MRHIAVIVALMIFVFFSIFSSFPASAQPTVVIQEDFESAVLPSASNPKWRIGAQKGGVVGISTDRAQNYLGSAGSLKGVYPANPIGESYVWANYMMSELKATDVCIDMRAKLPSTPVRGMKFFKVFGQKGVDGSYANSTFGPIYASGIFREVLFGDGATIGNDAQRSIRFDGTSPEIIGRSRGIAKVLTPQMRNYMPQEWGNDWHHVRIRVKFNSGTSADTERPDGEYYVEIDGRTYLDASAVFNRHWSNLPISHVGLFGWTQVAEASPGFEVWYDNVVISTGGCASSAAPSAPAPSAPEVSVE